MSLSLSYSLRRAAVAALACFLISAAASRADQTVTVSANDQMKFDTTDINARVGQKIVLILTNDGSRPKHEMGHNLVILKPGTDVMAFIAAASASQRAASDYLPEGDQATRMIVHTKMLGPGEEDTITFTPAVAGTYEYVCTFPGHTAAGMRGKIIVQ